MPWKTVFPSIPHNCDYHGSSLFTDMSQSPCAYSEAPAEGSFSIYSRVSLGKERSTIDHLIALTRVAAHGTPASTVDAANFSEAALKNFQSIYGERFCSKNWIHGISSTTISKHKNRKWDW